MRLSQVGQCSLNRLGYQSDLPPNLLHLIQQLLVLLVGFGKLRFGSFLRVPGFIELKHGMLLHTFQPLGRFVDFLLKRTLLGGKGRL